MPRVLLALALLFAGSVCTAPALSAQPAPPPPPGSLVLILADQPFSERPPGRVIPSQVKKDRYLLYIPATGDDLVSFSVVAPRSGAYRATTRLFNQEDPGSARLIINEFTDGPLVPLAGTMQHGVVQLVAGTNIVTYQLSGTAARAKVRLWELTFVPVVPVTPEAAAKPAEPAP
jgi:hypothetical protein